MVDEAKKIITTIRQMEASLDDSARRSRNLDDEELQITYPLTRCLQTLREKQNQISRLHKERYEQVKSKSTASHLFLTMSDAMQNSRKHSNHTHHISNQPSSKSRFLLPAQTSLSLLASTSPHPTSTSSMLNLLASTKSTRVELRMFRLWATTLFNSGQSSVHRKRSRTVAS